MELWYSENHTKNVRLSVKINRHIHSGKSDFQRIDILESLEFGRVLTLDGLIMLTERDEFVYHEMMAHVPLAVNPKIETVLVIGGGDGGAVRELAKYPGIARIDLVEIDKMVVEVCKEFLPALSCAFSDSRIEVHYQDGLKFIRHHQNEYDLIIVDSTDPFGPGEGLFTKEFYGNCYNALKERGIMICQMESPFYKSYSAEMARVQKKVSSIFPVARAYQAHIPTYPCGHWLFGFASKGLCPLEDLDESWKGLSIAAKYYNLPLHRGAFALPTYILEALKNA
ncbi:MAG: polyamine aminopropyltransferase [Spirochaetes bacterium]|nr:polyamine aminopropyltransferase [Spirochaetota bacterium]